MRKLRTTLLAGAGLLLVAGAAVAAEQHVMNVALPDGSVAQVHYEGDVAPQFVLVDAPVQRIALEDPFAEMDRMFAAMEMQHQAMMQQVAQMEAQAADAMQQAQSQTRTVAVTKDGSAPAGVVQYSFVSTTSADGCTTSVQWSSDGSKAEPQVYKTSSGNCAAKPEEVKPTKAKASKAEEDKTIPGASRT